MDWISNTYKILDTILCTNTEYLVKSTNFVIKEFELDKIDYKIDYTNLQTKLFLFYIDVKTKVDSVCSHLYNNYGFVKTFVDKTNYNIDTIKAVYNNVRIEPLNDNWVCISLLLKNDNKLFSGNNEIYLEHYQYIKQHNSADISQKQYYNDCLNYFVNTAKSISSCNNNVVETMITMKLKNQYYNKCFNKSFNKENSENEAETCYSNTETKVSFLSVEYTHPNMKNKVVMNIPKDVMIQGNIIMSPLFIKRYLEYQYEYYIFDENYKVNIMDNNVNMLSLKYTDSILLSEKSYSVIKNE